MARPDGAARDRFGRPARGPARLLRAIWALEPEQRVAAGAALALWLSMFLPWYSKTVLAVVKNSLQRGGYDLSAFGAFSFVEAAVLLVASATLALLFARAERRAFHLPGGDGLVILAGGIWVSVLIFYRMLDKPVLTGNDRYAASVGLQWGIFFAMAASISLAYAGARVRAAHRPEPALRDDPTVPRRVSSRRPPRRTPPPSGAGPPPEPRATPRVPPRPDTQLFDADPPQSFETEPQPFDADPTQRLDGDPQRRPDGAKLADDDGAPPPGPEDPPTRVVRRVPRFDDLDAEWIPTDRLSLEAEPPVASDDER